MWQVNKVTGRSCQTATGMVAVMPGYFAKANMKNSRKTRKVGNTAWLLSMASRVDRRVPSPSENDLSRVVSSVVTAVPALLRAEQQQQQIWKALVRNISIVGAVSTVAFVSCGIVVVSEEIKWVWSFAFAKIVNATWKMIEQWVLVKIFGFWFIRTKVKF